MSYYLQALTLMYIFIFSSCATHFDKRKYTQRNYVDVHSAPAEIETSSPIKSNSQVIKLSDQFMQSESDIKTKQSTNKLMTKVRPDEPCDRIYFDDGTQAEVKVLDVNDKEVAYRKCNDLNSPVIILNKKHISKIEFYSGVRYETDSDINLQQNNQQEQVQKVEEASNQSQKPKQVSAKEGLINILALVFAVIGLIMLILAFTNVWFWLFGATIFSALGASLGWFGINKRFKGLAIIALIIGTVCSVLASVLFGLL